MRPSPQPTPADGRGRQSRRGRILSVKWGFNPNSSSLGVDVTFLLLGMAAIALLTPIIALILRFRSRPALPAAPEEKRD